MDSGTEAKHSYLFREQEENGAEETQLFSQSAPLAPLINGSHTQLTTSCYGSKMQVLMLFHCSALVLKHIYYVLSNLPDYWGMGGQQKRSHCEKEGHKIQTMN